MPRRRQTRLRQQQPRGSRVYELFGQEMSTGTVSSSSGEEATHTFVVLEDAKEAGHDGSYRTCDMHERSFFAKGEARGNRQALTESQEV